MSGLLEHVLAGAQLWGAALSAKATAERYECAGHLDYNRGGFYPGLLIQFRTHGGRVMCETLTGFGSVLASTASMMESDVCDPAFLSDFLALGLKWDGEAPEIDGESLKTWIVDARRNRGLPSISLDEVERGIHEGIELFVTLYSHRHGITVDVCVSMEAALAERRATAAGQWQNEFRDRTPPEDPDHLADQYFDLMGFDESFEITPVKMGALV